jgi:hypothetical protein
VSTSVVEPVNQGDDHAGIGHGGYFEVGDKQVGSWGLGGLG